MILVAGAARVIARTRKIGDDHLIFAVTAARGGGIVERYAERRIRG